jgi:sulfur carrier protein ThiS
MIRVAGADYPWHEGMTVADLLAERNDGQDYPVVRVKNHYISRLNFARTTIPDNVEVFLIPMIAGG